MTPTTIWHRVVVFAIDKGDDIHTRAKFLHHIDVLRAVGKMTSPVRTGIGRWQDPETGHIHLEDAYLMSVADYLAHVVPPGWVNDQLCVLSASPRHAALADHNLRGPTPLKGTFRPIGQAMPEGDWTYFHDDGFFWQVRP